VNALVRLGYRGAYWCARAWWFVRRPQTHGAAVALWSGGRLLLVRTCYRTRYVLPGGFVGRHEDARDAASRELLEEVGVAVSPSDLTLACEHTLFLEHHHDRLTIFETVVSPEPQVEASGRELVWIGWKTAEEAEQLPLLSRHLRAYLAQRSSRTAT
jgi:ADP-ribose pyrophosphatase YjhB (NUDIX family)